MYPVLFKLGPLTIHTYGLLVALGLIIGLFTIRALSESSGIRPGDVTDIAFSMIIWGIIGSRAAYVLLNLNYYLAHPIDIIKIWQGGLVFSGGLVLSIIALTFHIRKKGLNFWETCDLFSIGVAIGQAIGRLGCFSAGCCYGKPADIPWSVVFKNPDSLAPLNIPLHPTQLYHALSSFIIFLILLILRRKRKFQGQVFIWFLILHSTGRLLIERFRGDWRGFIPGTQMSVTQLITLLVLIGAIVLLFIKKPKEEKKIFR